MDDENASLGRFSPRKFQLGENRVGDVEATTDKFRWFDASSNCGYLNYHWETRSLKFLRDENIDGLEFLSKEFVITRIPLQMYC